MFNTLATLGLSGILAIVCGTIGFVINKVTNTSYGTIIAFALAMICAILTPISWYTV